MATDVLVLSGGLTKQDDGTFYLSLASDTEVNGVPCVGIVINPQSTKYKVNDDSSVSVMFAKPLRLHSSDVTEYRMRPAVVSDIIAIEEYTGGVERIFRAAAQLGNAPYEQLVKLPAKEHDKVTEAVRFLFETT